VEQPPEFAQKLKYAFNTIGVPMACFAQAGLKHLVHAQGIGAITLNQNHRD